MATKRGGTLRGSDEGGLDSLFTSGAPGVHDEPTGDLAEAAAAVRTGPVVTPLVLQRTDAIEQARLEYVAPDGTGHTRVLLDSTTIGRHTENDVQLLDPEVSKAHLVIRRTKDGYLLEDLNSANGTLVNGARQQRFRLKDNDVLVVGNTALRFRLELQAARGALNTGDRPPGERKSKSLSTFAAMTDARMKAVRSDPVRSRPGEDSVERTTVTLVPSLSGEEENVFAEEPPDDHRFRSAENIREDKQLRRDYERLRVAFDLANAIGLETDLPVLGQQIISRIKDVLPADTAVVMLRDPTLAGGELVTLASWADRDTEVRIPKAIIERVLETRRGLLSADAQKDSQLRRSETVVGQRIRSALCVPLVVKDDVVGIIHLSSSSAAGAYEEKDLALLRAIAQPVGLAVANARLRQKAEEDAHQRATLSRFLSPALVEKVVSNELNVSAQGDKLPATVLFSDIRGFTTISDGKAPEAVVSMLNEYFEAMVEVVFELGGTLDKFIGDGLMAVWGTPVQGEDDPIMAVRAASVMRARLESVVNVARTRRGEAPLTAGYGIATGTVIAGAMGAQRRLDFTVIGDTVNLSSRLCGQARPGQILVCENTERVCRRQGLPLQALEPRIVKGVSRPVPVWQVPRDPLFLDKTPPDRSLDLAADRITADRGHE